MTVNSSNVSFLLRQQVKTQTLSVHIDLKSGEKQQIFTSEKLELVNGWHFKPLISQSVNQIDCFSHEVGPQGSSITLSGQYLVKLTQRVAPPPLWGGWAVTDGNVGQCFARWHRRSVNISARSPPSELLHPWVSSLSMRGRKSEELQVELPSPAWPWLPFHAAAAEASASQLLAVKLWTRNQKCFQSRIQELQTGSTAFWGPYERRRKYSDTLPKWKYSNITVETLNCKMFLQLVCFLFILF